MAVAAAAATMADPFQAAAVADPATANTAAAATAPAAAPATAVSMNSVAVSIDPPAVAAHATNDVAFIGTHVPVVAPVNEVEAPAAKPKHMQLLVQSLSLSHQQLQQKYSLMSSECQSLRDHVQVSEQGQQHLLEQNAQLARENARLTEQNKCLEASVQRVTTQAAKQVRVCDAQPACCCNCSIACCSIACVYSCLMDASLAQHCKFDVGSLALLLSHSLLRFLDENFQSAAALHFQTMAETPAAS